MQTTTQTTSTLSVGLLQVDRDGYIATFDGQWLDVTRTQLELLGLLIENQGRVLSRVELSNALGLARERSVDVILTGLRRIIRREFVRNVRGRGWILEPDLLER